MREARFRTELHPAMELRIRTLGTAQLHLGGDPFDGQRRFSPQPCRHRQFVRIAHAMASQVRLFPSQALQLLPFGERLEEILPVHIIQNNVLPPVAAAYDGPMLCSGSKKLKDAGALAPNRIRPGQTLLKGRS